MVDMKCCSFEISSKHVSNFYLHICNPRVGGGLKFCTAIWISLILGRTSSANLFRVTCFLARPCQAAAPLLPPVPATMHFLALCLSFWLANYLGRITIWQVQSLLIKWNKQDLKVPKFNPIKHRNRICVSCYLFIFCSYVWETEKSTYCSHYRGKGSLALCLLRLESAKRCFPKQHPPPRAVWNILL